MLLMSKYFIRLGPSSAFCLEKTFSRVRSESNFGNVSFTAHIRMTRVFVDI